MLVGMAVKSEKQGKRTTNPGVRVIGGRIYDSSNGKTCHQCRQKTMDFAASCKFMKKDKPCRIKYCHKCLLNRYGENAEDVVLLDEWTCPKCRGICNCSFCMKKRGHQPTGILVHTAKATGFSSVSELLQVKSPEKFSYQRPEKMETLVTSPRKPGKENFLEGKGDLMKEEPRVKVPTNTNRERLKELTDVSGVEFATEGSRPKKIKISAQISETVPNNCVSEEVRYKEASQDLENNNLEGEIKKTKATQKLKKCVEHEVAKEVENNNVEGKIKKPKATHKLKKCNVESNNEDIRFEAQLPEGISSITISGIDLPPEDVGNVLQFLEFCSAFEKVLDLRKGQGQCVMRELFSGRGKRRQQYSMLIQMILQLSRVILKDRGESSISFSTNDERWFKAVGECVSESDLLDGFPSELFEEGIAEYEKLDTSKKLKLLNFLCDEALCTTELRNWIDNQSLEPDEMKKVAKEKVAAAKEKEKQLRLKLQDEVAKAVMEKSRAPLSIAEHEAIVSQIKAEVKEAHAEMVEAMGMLPKKRQRSDAVRTDPVILDENGRVFWNLTSHTTEEPNLLLQDVGTWGEVCPHEKWFAFKSEQKPELEKYLSCLRVKQHRARKNDKGLKQRRTRKSPDNVVPISQDREVSDNETRGQEAQIS